MSVWGEGQSYPTPARGVWGIPRNSCQHWHQNEQQRADQKGTWESLNWEGRQGNDAGIPKVFWSCGSLWYQGLCSCTASPFTCWVLLLVWGNTGDREGILCKIFSESFLGPFIWMRTCSSIAGDVFVLHGKGLFMDCCSPKQYNNILLCRLQKETFPANAILSFRSLEFFRVFCRRNGLLSLSWTPFYFPSKHHNHLRVGESRELFPVMISKANRVSVQWCCTEFPVAPRESCALCAAGLRAGESVQERAPDRVGKCQLWDCIQVLQGGKAESS